MAHSAQLDLGVPPNRAANLSGQGPICGPLCTAAGAKAVVGTWAPWKWMRGPEHVPEDYFKQRDCSPFCTLSTFGANSSAPGPASVVTLSPSPAALPHAHPQEACAPNLLFVEISGPLAGKGHSALTLLPRWKNRKLLGPLAGTWHRPGWLLSL